jgi:hypothetical protein
MELKVFQQGDVAKCIITSRNYNLDMEACDFRIELIYGMRGNKIVIQKSEMLYGTDGEFVMTVDTSKMVGKITARFVWYAIDTDIDPDNRRQEVDEQVIAFVVTDPCPQFFTCPKCGGEGHDVNYEWTDEPDIAAKYLRLVATETVVPEHGEPYIIYRPIITKNDEYIYALRESADALAAALTNAINN